MKLAIRDMLGLSPISSPMYCCCTGRKHKNKPNPKEGQRTDLLPNDMASAVHVATCKHRGGQIATHDALLRFIASIIKELPNAFARTEQTKIIANGRMDLIVHPIDSSTPTHYDLTVANPLAASYLQAAATKTLAAAAQREYDKNAKWFDRSKQNGYHFLALVLEITGGMSKNTERTLRRWAALMNAAAPYQPVNWAAPTRMSYIQQRCSVLMVRSMHHAVQNLLKYAVKDQVVVKMPHEDYPNSLPSSQDQDPITPCDSPPLPPKASPSF
jgi:hypothetical protein